MFIGRFLGAFGNKVSKMRASFDIELSVRPSVLHLARNSIHTDSDGSLCRSCPLNCVEPF